MPSLRKKYGIVILMDALGARQYSEDKIKRFLQARSRLNSMLAHQASSLKSANRAIPPPKPVTFTFGDTLVVVCELRVTKYRAAQIYAMLMLMQNYLFHSMEEGIVFRGAFSIGTYIDDAASNTVMGEALIDAASWYEKSDWFGLASTPRTNSVLELLFYEAKSFLVDPMFVIQYPVPMKDGRAIDLYTVSWAGRFFHNKTKHPEKTFIDAIQKLPVPLGTESKHINSKKYFYEVAHLLEAKKSDASK
ncbi:MAG: hypothetical protein FP821_05930 [Sideroxydans sp.]|nr:hypothetical protein [Sideroxydans sp.]